LVAKDWEGVCEKIKSILTPRVVNVKVSDRLASNPCVLVSDKYGWTPNMEKIMKAQALSAANNMPNVFSARRVLEINPKHAILKEIKACIDNKKEIKNIVDMLFDTVLLDSGFALEEPSKYAQTIYKMIMHGLSADLEDEAEAVDTTPLPAPLTNSPTDNMEDVD
jgi:molecular chaperone HtpG